MLTCLQLSLIERICLLQNADLVTWNYHRFDEGSIAYCVQGFDLIEVYIPEGLWYDAFTYKLISGGGISLMKIPLGQVSVLFKGGSIIPLQKARLVSAAVHSEPFRLAVTFPQLVCSSACSRSHDLLCRIVFLHHPPGVSKGILLSRWQPCIIIIIIITVAAIPECLTHRELYDLVRGESLA